MRDRRNSQKGLLSMREAARRLGIDRSSTLPELIRTGRIAVVLKGTRPAIPVSEVERIAQEGFCAARVKVTMRRARTKGSGKPGDAIRALTVRPHAER
jgi:hypothetical protein